MASIDGLPPPPYDATSTDPVPEEGAQAPPSPPKCATDGEPTGPVVPDFVRDLRALAREDLDEPIEQGLTDGQKSYLLFSIIFLAVMMTLYLVFSLATYPDFPYDRRFEHNPFAFAMISAGGDLFAIVVYTVQLYKNWGQDDVPWWMAAFLGISATMGFAMWIWGIVILDSPDGEILEEDYEKIYKLLLSAVCIVGGMLSLVALGGLCTCVAVTIDACCATY